MEKPSEHLCFSILLSILSPALLSCAAAFRPLCDCPCDLTFTEEQNAEAPLLELALEGFDQWTCTKKLLLPFVFRKSGLRTPAARMSMFVDFSEISLKGKICVLGLNCDRKH